jgi:hypothetical protein
MGHDVNGLQKGTTALRPVIQTFADWFFLSRIFYLTPSLPLSLLLFICFSRHSHIQAPAVLKLLLCAYGRQRNVRVKASEDQDFERTSVLLLTSSEVSILASRGRRLQVHNTVDDLSCRPSS